MDIKVYFDHSCFLGDTYDIYDGKTPIKMFLSKREAIRELKRLGRSDLIVTL